MDELRDTWNSISKADAAEFLTGRGSPSPNSKRMLVDLIKERAGGKRLNVLDLGCGNAHIFPALTEAGIEVAYTGVDFSEVLLAAAESSIRDPRAVFVRADVNSLTGVDGHFDIAIYSHVIEMLASPEQSIDAAARLADGIMIRFFEPPEFEFDSAEIRPLEFAAGKSYLRRKLGRDYYRMMLARIGCTEVDVYQDETAKDQVHVLHYGSRR